MLCALCTAPAKALDATRQASQLIHREWGRADGLPAEMVWSVHQTSDGYLWLGTEAGLARFDGAEFEVYSSATHDAFVVDDVRHIDEAQDGTLWIATFGGGVLALKGGRFERFDRDAGLAVDNVYAVKAASNGDVWAGTTQGVCRLRSGAFTCWTGEDGALNGRVMRLAEDAAGTIWLGGLSDGLASFDGERFTRYPPDDTLKSTQIFMLHADAEFNMLVGDYSGRYYRAGAAGIERVTLENLPENLAPMAALRDADGNLLVGMNAGGGLWRLQPDVHRLDSEGLPVSFVFDLAEDRDGGVWVATTTGLHHLRAGPIVPWGQEEGVANGTFVVSADADGGVWAGAEAEGLFHVDRDGRVERWTMDDGLPAASVSALWRDDDGTFWAGTYGGGIALLRDGAIVDVWGTAQGLPGLQVTVIYRDSRGALWIATGAGFSRWVDGVHQQT
ncbi:MAG: two-component regulator propeller domain-containing protein, partial [Pseudomonadota bacterium]